MENDGSVTHELVVVRGKRPEQLPTTSDGAVDEARIPAARTLGSVEDLVPGATTSITLAFRPGEYILLCNRVDEDDPSDTGGVSHYVERMFTTITVARA